MQTRKVLASMKGEAPLNLGDGDGPLARVASKLLASFETAEAERLDRADLAAGLVGSGPMLEVLQRRFAEAEARSLFDQAAPVCMRFDAYTVLSDAAKASPGDRGLKLAAAHAKDLWMREPDGVLAVGDVARLRAHWMREFPKSRVASVLDNGLGQIGFNTLPVAKLAQLASHIRGRSEAELTASYETVVRAHGLAGNKPESIRARAYLRGLVHLASDDDEDVSVHTAERGGAERGGEAAADRVLRRMAAYDDPILRSVVGQLDMEPELVPGEVDDAGNEEPSPLEDPGLESEVPHDEEGEAIVEAESPITGEPIVLEVTVPEPAPEAEGDVGEEAGLLGPGGETGQPLDTGMDVTPGDVQGLSMFGQLEDFVADDPAIDEEEVAGTPGDIPMVDEGGGETVVQVEDPTAPGEMLDITISPASDEGELDGGLPSVPTDVPLEGEGGHLASRRRGGSRGGSHGGSHGGSRGVGHPFAVYAVRGGRRSDVPLERFVATSMSHALGRVARSLGELGAGGEVRGDPDTFVRHALVVLDADAGSHLYVVAEAEKGDEFYPRPILTQPNAREQAGESFASTEYMGKGPGKQKVIDNDGAKEKKKDATTRRSRAMSKDQVAAACKAAGLTRDRIEAAMLGGETVGHGTWALAIDDAASVTLSKAGAVVKTASVASLDAAIHDFMARVAVDVRNTHVTRGANKPGGQPTAPAAAPARVYATLHPLFRVGCAQCGSIDDYVMPKTASAVRCSGCGYQTAAELVAVQLESKSAQLAYPGYLLVAPIPGEASDREMNARRLLAAIQEVVPEASGTMHTATLEVELRPVDERQLARIRNVLATKFGVGFKATPKSAQTTDPSSGTSDTTGPGGATNQELQSTIPQTVSPLTVQSPTTPTFSMPSPNTPGQTGPTSPTATMPNNPRPLPIGGGSTGVQNSQTVGMGGAPGSDKGSMGGVGGNPMTTPTGSSVQADFIAEHGTLSTSDLRMAAPSRRWAQSAIPAPPPEGPAPGEPPEPLPGGAGPGAPGEAPPLGAPPEMGAGGPGQPGQLSPEAVEVIKASMVALRNTGIDVASGVQEFLSQFRQWLDGFGDKSSPSRARVGGTIVDAAREAWSKPAILQVAPKMASATSATSATRRVAKEPGKMPTPKNIKPQHGPWVKVPSDAAKLLGPDSATDAKVTESIVPGGKIKSQPSKPHGTGKLSPTGWGDHVLTESKDPDRFGAEMPPSGGSYGLVGEGTSLTPTDLGSDSMTGGNPTTQAWDGVASGAGSNMRSKPGGVGAPNLTVHKRAIVQGLAALQVRPQSMAARHLASAIRVARNGHWPEAELWAASDAGLADRAAAFPERERSLITAALDALVSEGT